jgi:hypothetical protein
MGWGLQTSFLELGTTLLSVQHLLRTALCLHLHARWRFPQWLMLLLRLSHHLVIVVGTGSGDIFCVIGTFLAICALHTNKMLLLSINTELLLLLLVSQGSLVVQTLRLERLLVRVEHVQRVQVQLYVRYDQRRRLHACLLRSLWLK